MRSPHKIRTRGSSVNGCGSSHRLFLALVGSRSTKAVRFNETSYSVHRTVTQLWKVFRAHSFRSLPFTAPQPAAFSNIQQGGNLMRLPTTLALVSGLALLATGASAVAEDHDRDRDDVRRVQTATPIKHIVVIFQENVSFDHYFGTYPKALNLAGETPFAAKKDTPKVNNLVTPLDVNNHFAPLAGIDLINNNPNNSQTA